MTNIFLYVTLNLFLLKITFAQDESHNYEIESQLSNKLRICDSLVGDYIHEDRHRLDGTLFLYDEQLREKMIINQFYYMVFNCYEYLDENYKDSYIDDSLLLEIDWIPILKSDDFVDTHKDQQFSLTEREERIKLIMANEKLKIKHQNDESSNFIDSFIIMIGIEFQTFINMSVALILSTLFFSLCCSFKWLIQDTMNHEKKKISKMPKFNQKIE